MLRETTKTISIEMIQKTVSRFFNVPVVELRAKRRNKNVVQARQVAMYLCRHLSDMALPEIGNAFGGKDHTTVLHSYKKIEQEIQTSSQFKKVIEDLSTSLKQ